MMPRRAGFKIPSLPYFGMAHKAITPRMMLATSIKPHTAANPIRM